MKHNKSFFALLLCTVMLLQTAFFPVSADESDTIVLNAMDFSLTAGEYYDTSPDSFDNTWYDDTYFPIEVSKNPPFLEMRISEWLTYRVNAPVSGIYRIGVLAACSQNVQLGLSTDDYITESYFEKTYDSTLNFVTRDTSMYLYLENGENTIRLQNISGTYICIKEIYFTLSQGNEQDIIPYFEAENNVEGVLTPITENHITYVPATNETVLTYGFDGLTEGIYDLYLSGTALYDVSCDILSDGVAVPSVPMAFHSTAYQFQSQKIASLRLDEGAHELKLTFYCGEFRFDKLWLKPQASSEELLLYSIQLATNSFSVYDALSRYGEIFGIDVNADTTELFYPELSFGKLAGKSFFTVEELNENYQTVLSAELLSPTVTLYNSSGTKVNKLSAGNFRLAVNGAKFPGTASFVVAEYRGGRLVGNIFCTENTGASIRFVLRNLSADSELKIFPLESLDSIKPYYRQNYRDLYVAKNGSDTNSGTKDSPFAGVQRALQEVAVLNSAMNGDIVIHVGAGTYFLPEKLLIDDSMSGKNGYRVILQAEDKENPPILSGGEQLLVWTKQEDTPLWVSDATAADTRTLYINGYPATLARSKYLYRAAAPLIPENPVNQYHITDGLILPKANFPSGLEQESGLSLVYNNQWATQRLPVEAVSYDDKNATLLMKQPYYFSASYWMGLMISPHFDKYFYLENAFSLLDEPGEFYFDRTTKKIYYYPYPEEDMNNVSAYCGVTEQLLDIIGTDKDNKIENFVLEGICFRYGALNSVTEESAVFHQTDDRRIGTVGWYRDAMFPAQVTVQNAENILIKNCEFSCLGSNALNMDEAVTNSRVSGNLFCDISGTGVVAGSFSHGNSMDSTTKKRCSNIEIDNNIFRRCAQEFLGLTAISAYYAGGVNIHHNDIKDMPYSGISFGWGWGSDVADCKDNKVSYNRIENVMQILEDGGHIYTLSVMPNTQITDNYLINSGDSRGGIYLDQGSGDLSICDNVVTESERWLFARSGADLSNVYVGFNHSDVPLGDYDTNAVTLKSNVRVTDGNWSAAAQKIMSDAGLEDKTRLTALAEYPAWRRMRMYDIATAEFAKSDINHVWIQANTYTNHSSATSEIYADNSIGDTRVGNWFEYTVSVPKNGNYRITVCSGGLTATNIPQFELYLDMTAWESIVGTTPDATGTLPTYSSDYYISGLADLGTHYLTAGTHKIRLKMVGKESILRGLRLENTDMTGENDSRYDEGQY